MLKFTGNEFVNESLKAPTFMRVKFALFFWMPRDFSKTSIVDGHPKSQRKSKAMESQLWPGQKAGNLSV